MVEEEVRRAYNVWSEQYDSNENKTRDMEGKAIRQIFKEDRFDRILELGCGTGKNSVWLSDICGHLTSVDLSEQMIEIARSKLLTNNVQFHIANILEDWIFASGTYNLVVCSLMLEHIEDLNHIFHKISAFTSTGSKVYIGELHPFKQYNGSKARFETEDGLRVVPCFTHHISEFIGAAQAHGFKIIELKEFFDNDDMKQIPRLLCLVFEKL